MYSETYGAMNTEEKYIKLEKIDVKGIT